MRLWLLTLAVLLPALQSAAASSPQIKTSGKNVLLVVPEGANVSIAYVDEQNNVVGVPTQVATQRDISSLLNTIAALNESLTNAIKALDTSVKSQIAQEASRTASSVGGLGVNFTTSLGGLNATLQTTIGQETSRTTNNVNSLGQSLSSSLSALNTSMKSTLTQEISLASTTTTNTFNQSLQSLSSTLRVSISQEASRAINAESALHNEVNTFIATLTSTNTSSSPSAVSEALRAQSVEFSLAQSIGALSDALNVERTRAMNAEGTLATNTLTAVGNENTRASGVESALSTSIATSQSTTRAADNMLNATLLGEVSAGTAETGRAIGVETSLGASLSGARTSLVTLNTTLTAVQTAQTSASAALVTLTASQAAIGVGLASLNATVGFNYANLSSAIATSNTAAASSTATAAINTALTNEITRALGVEQSLGQQITRETSRAMFVEASMATMVVSNGVGAPYWLTPHGWLANFNAFSSVFPLRVAVTDPGVNPVQYRVVAGSLPPGVALGLDGVFTGSVTLDVTRVYNFTIQATIAAINQNLSRSFSIVTFRRLVTLSTGVTYYDTLGTPQAFTLNSPGTVYTLTVHSTFHLFASLFGAAGSTLYSSGVATFGYGGMVSGTLQSLSPGTYYLVIGTQPSANTGGYPGGGLGQDTAGSGGGGFTGLWQGTSDPLDVSNRPSYLLLAGAGGGHSKDYTCGTSYWVNSTVANPGYPRAGDGGYPTGSVGNANVQAMVVPTGGTQTAGGSAGINAAGTQGATPGSVFVGGSSGSCSSGNGGGGAGGAGWYGGGGGNAHCGDGGGAGGGGSSYFNASLVANFSFTNAISTSNGFASFVVGAYSSSAAPYAGPVWLTPAGSLGSFNFGSSVYLVLNAIDYEGDAVTYALSSGALPPGISFSVASNLLTLSGTVTSDVTQIYTFTFTATSGDSFSLAQTFSLTTLKRWMSIGGVTYYDTPGSTQTVTLPYSTNAAVAATVFNPLHVRVTCVGAAGSTLYNFTGGATFGYGGAVTGTVYSLAPAANYYFVSGQQPTAGTGGYPGGGTGQYSGAAGGGFSGFWQGTSNPLAVANRPTYYLLGGAGAGRSGTAASGSSNSVAAGAANPGYLRAGDGAYPSGTVGNANGATMTIPTGGTQTAPGAAGVTTPGTQGATAGALTGFVGGSSGSCGTTGTGGAGGAGWFGGGGGNAHCGDGGGAGGGGSSYYDPNTVFQFSFSNANNTGSGYVVVTMGVYAPTPGITWVSPAAGSLGSVNFNTAISYALYAYEQQANVVVYSITTGSLPAGVTLTQTGGRALISGTPTLDRTQTYTFTVTASFGSFSASRTFSITVLMRLATIGATTYFDIGSRQTVSLTYTGSAAAITVLNTFNMTVTCTGAAGSTLYASTTTAATYGYGGSVTAVVRVSPGTYYAVVGQQPTAGTGGYPGGGTGQFSGAAGGGFSGFWQGTSNPLAVANRPTYILVGGAGAGHSSNLVDPGSSNSVAAGAANPGYLRAGDGAYPSGTVGNANGPTMIIATGGTQTAPGAAGVTTPGTQGATAGALTGFVGGSSGSCGTTGTGGAGGAGWFGGGGGNAHCGDGGGAGGGGSSYVNASLVLSGTFTFANAANSGAGSVTLLLN